MKERRAVLWKGNCSDGEKTDHESQNLTEMYDTISALNKIVSASRALSRS